MMNISSTDLVRFPHSMLRVHCLEIIHRLYGTYLSAPLAKPECLTENMKLLFVAQWSGHHHTCQNKSPLVPCSDFCHMVRACLPLFHGTFGSKTRWKGQLQTNQDRKLRAGSGSDVACYFLPRAVTVYSVLLNVFWHSRKRQRTEVLGGACHSKPFLLNSTLTSLKTVKHSKMQDFPCFSLCCSSTRGLHDMGLEERRGAVEGGTASDQPRVFGHLVEDPSISNEGGRGVKLCHLSLVQHQDPGGGGSTDQMCEVLKVEWKRKSTVTFHHIPYSVLIEKSLTTSGSKIKTMKIFKTLKVHFNHRRCLYLDSRDQGENLALADIFTQKKVVLSHGPGALGMGRAGMTVTDWSNTAQPPFPSNKELSI